MGQWLLGIIGIAFVSVILEVIIPEGSTKKIIQCVFAIFSIYVIIAPLPKLFSSAEEAMSESQIVLDESFLHNTNSQIVSALEKKIESEANEKGFGGISVMIWADLSNNEIDIKKVYVDMSNVVLSAEAENINKYEVLTELVQKHVNVDKEDIAFHG